MNYYDVSMVGNVGKYRDVLTYQHPDRLDTGTLVNVPVGQQTSLGVVTRRITKPDFVCKDISRVAIEHPLPSQLVQLHHWMVDYYATSSGVGKVFYLPRSLLRPEPRHFLRRSSRPDRLAMTVHIICSMPVSALP